MNVCVHRTDVVSISTGCSNSPVAVDVDGVIRLSNSLEQITVKDNNTSENTVNIIIPNHMDWIVTMWHFGADSLADYCGKENHRRLGKG